MKNKSICIHIQYFLNLTVVSILYFFKTTSCLDQNFLACKPKKCGNQTIKFPFYIEGEQEPFCGYPGFSISCEQGHPILRKTQNTFQIEQIFYQNRSLHLIDTVVLNLENGCFPKINNPSFGQGKFEIEPSSNMFLFSNCSSFPNNLSDYRIGCEGETQGLAMFGKGENFTYASGICKVVVFAKVELKQNDGIWNYVEVLKRGFMVKWFASDCGDCEQSGGRCGFNDSSYHFKCFCSDRPHKVRCNGSGKERRRVLILATVLPGFFIAIFALGILTIRYRKKWKDASSYISSRTFASDASSKPDLEEGGFFFGVPVFSYAELEEATNYFDAMKELGDGGFGTVYFGKLRDGREVAVKRLYEHNYKRAIQFRNEVEILTRLRHHNLVNLYGCTSHHSRELLLVYEYISNGTVADHLHGDRAKDKTIMWPIRINIAIETASALAYLHASDIIHRDVKTNNILLDDNFCVKVADFGLSRLFPNNVTHVSTAPQGTPGYVDPEYHQCYQLTEKSDVYSFGVVLIELISSLPAVDINRRRHEINLANLAMNKIQKGAFDELIDPRLESASDPSIERMVTSVAEVAFRCLQLEKEMRPSMDEVLDTLREIREYKDEKMGHRGDDFTSAKKSPHSAKGDDIILLKTNNIVPHSPNSVADRWVSTSASLSSG